MDDTNERKVDLLAEAGELMRRFAKGEAIGGSLAALVQSLEPDALYESAKTWGVE